MTRSISNQKTLSASAALFAACALAGPVVTETFAQTRSLGVDVSDWQNQNSTSTPIDWTTAHNAGGKSFAFIRSTRGGTTGTYNEQARTGTLSQRYDDYAFIYNITHATSAGVLAGPYHFMRGDLTSNTGADEANHMIQMAGTYVAGDATRADFMRPGYLLPTLDLEAGAGIRTPDQLAAMAVE